MKFLVVGPDGMHMFDRVEDVVGFLWSLVPLEQWKVYALVDTVSGTGGDLKKIGDKLDRISRL